MKTLPKDALSPENVSYSQPYPRSEIRVEKNANFRGFGAFRARSARMQITCRMCKMPAA